MAKEQRRLEKAVIKIAVVPTGPPDEKTGKVKKSKPRVKFDLQGFGAYIPSGFSIGGMPADEPTMIIKII